MHGWETISAQRLFDEVRAAGYAGGYGRVREYAGTARPRDPLEAAVRFERDQRGALSPLAGRPYRRLGATTRRAWARIPSGAPCVPESSPVGCPTDRDAPPRSALRTSGQ